MANLRATACTIYVRIEPRWASPRCAGLRCLRPRSNARPALGVRPTCWRRDLDPPCCSSTTPDAATDTNRHRRLVRASGGRPSPPPSRDDVDDFRPAPFTSPPCPPSIRRTRRPHQVIDERRLLTRHPAAVGRPRRTRLGALMINGITPSCFSPERRRSRLRLFADVIGLSASNAGGRLGSIFACRPLRRRFKSLGNGNPPPALPDVRRQSCHARLTSRAQRDPKSRRSVSRSSLGPGGASPARPPVFPSTTPAPFSPAYPGLALEGGRAQGAVHRGSGSHIAARGPRSDTE